MASDTEKVTARDVTTKMFNVNTGCEHGHELARNCRYCWEFIIYAYGEQCSREALESECPLPPTEREYLEAKIAFLEGVCSTEPETTISKLVQLRLLKQTCDLAEKEGAREALECLLLSYRWWVEVEAIE